MMNRFWTGKGPCRANLHKWGLTQSPSCDCGQRQTTNHIVDTRPLTESEGGLNLLHVADDDAVIWLESTATAALAKLPRDATLARFMLSSCVRPSVCHKSVLYRNHSTNRAGCWLISTCSTLRFEENWFPLKNKGSVELWT